MIKRDANILTDILRRLILEAVEDARGRMARIRRLVGDPQLG